MQLLPDNTPARMPEDLNPERNEAELEGACLNL
jgi:hypothetical protein